MKSRMPFLPRHLLLLVFTAGSLLGCTYPQTPPSPVAEPDSWDNTGSNRWDNTRAEKWADEFALVTIRSSADATEQPAYFFKAAPGGAPKPLIVSLHTWSGDHAQSDPLAPIAKEAGWNYIHPGFRGPNSTPDACLSEKAMADIDDAIQYAIDNSNTDVDNVFVVGASGGGYATLGSYLRTRHTVRVFIAWVPISDLSAWYHQLPNDNTGYARDILTCTSSGDTLDNNVARSRSPLYWDLPEKPNGRLEIYAGIHDGHTGSVPISHSILFYNRMATHSGRTDRHSAARGYSPAAHS
jgi:dienelactone hydrolase